MRRLEVLSESHDDPQADNLAIDKTYQRLAVAYYWNMFRDVAKHIRVCDTYQRTKVEQASPVGLMDRWITEALIDCHCHRYYGTLSA